MMKVRITGTTGEGWRAELRKKLKISSLSTKECEGESCDFTLTVITPQADSLCEIAQAINDSVISPESSIFCVLKEYEGNAFNLEQLKDLAFITRMIGKNGASVFTGMPALIKYLNTFHVVMPYNPNIVECLIERDGATEVNIGKTSYLFEKNILGDYVCEVLSMSHRQHLLKLKDFAIYQEELAPKKEFNDEESDFMAEWTRTGADRFLAYVNGNIIRFNDSTDKIRKIAVTKWKTLLPHMQCPILPVSKAKPVPNSEFHRRWYLLNGKGFKKFVAENETSFLDCHDTIYRKAIEKWSKLIKAKTGEEWPIEDNLGGEENRECK